MEDDESACVHVLPSGLRMKMLADGLLRACMRVRAPIARHRLMLSGGAGVRVAAGVVTATATINREPEREREGEVDREGGGGEAKISCFGSTGKRQR